MRAKRFVALTACFLSGAGASYVLARDSYGVDSRSQPDLKLSLVNDAYDASSTSSLTFSGRLTQLIAAADRTDGDLVSGIESMLTLPVSVRRNLDLEFLFARLLETDPGRAIALIQRVEVPYRLRSAVFRRWTRTNPVEAMASLRQFDDPWTESLLALAILDVAGFDDALVERLVAEGRTLDLAGLQVAALAQRAATDPAGAFNDIPRLQSHQAQQAAYVQVARAAAELDPSSAVAWAQSISDADSYFSHRTRFLRELYKQWSRNDVDGFLEHIKTLDPTDASLPAQLAFSLRFAMESDPLRALEFADELSGELGVYARSAALEILAVTQPRAALEHVASQPLGQQRDQLLNAAATGYARYDLDQALAWLSTLSVSDNAIAHSAIAGALADVDLSRAIDLELSGGGGLSAAWLGIPMGNDLVYPEQAANRLASAEADYLLAVTLSRWAARDPHAVTAWMQTRQDLPSTAIRFVAQELGSQDILAAINYADSLPADRRDDWIQAAVVQGALVDAAGTVRSLELVRDEPNYELAMAVVIGLIAQRQGPLTAAELAGQSPSRASASAIAQSWAEIDPAAAARWAAGLPDAEVREPALSLICTSAPETAGCG